MTEDMPEDVKAAATSAVYGADGRGMIGLGRRFLQDRVARAILAERRRCAQIAAAEQEAMERAADSYRVPVSEANVRLADLHDQGATVAGRLATAILLGGGGSGLG